MLAQTTTTLILLALFTSILLLVQAQEPQQLVGDTPSPFVKCPSLQTDDGDSEGTQLLESVVVEQGDNNSLQETFAWRRTRGHVSHAACGGGGHVLPVVAALSGVVTFPGLDVSAEDNSSFDPHIYATGGPGLKRQHHWMPQDMWDDVQLQRQLETTSAQPWDSYARLLRRYGAPLLQIGPPSSAASF